MLDKVTEFRLALIKKGFRVRSIKPYHGDEGIRVDLLSPLQQGEFIKVAKELGYCNVEQSGISTNIIR